MIEVSHVGRIDMIRENFRHAELSEQIQTFFQFISKAESHWNGGGCRNIAVGKGHAESNANGKIGSPPTKTLVGFADPVGEEVEFSADTQVENLRSK